MLTAEDIRDMADDEPAPAFIAPRTMGTAQVLTAHADAALADFVSGTNQMLDHLRAQGGENSRYARQAKAAIALSFLRAGASLCDDPQVRTMLKVTEDYMRNPHTDAESMDGLVERIAEASEAAIRVLNGASEYLRTLDTEPAF